MNNVVRVSPRQWTPTIDNGTAPRLRAALLCLAFVGLQSCGRPSSPEFRQALSSAEACIDLVKRGLRDVPDDRARRFLGKVQPDTAECRGGPAARSRVEKNPADPWVDWSSYWAAADAGSRFAYDERWARFLPVGPLERLHVDPNIRGIDGALIDLEYQRVELIKFNLFDNYTFESYVKGAGGLPGRTLSEWPEMRLPATHPQFAAVGGDAARQECSGELIRHRTLTGICNDTFNPLMGSSNTLFARNVEFTEVFPEQGLTELTRNRHGDRLGLMKPDPQEISRALFTRVQSHPDLCNAGLGLPDEDPAAHCDYHAAPFFNVLAAYWIQFMTHDWFSHLREGENGPPPALPAGCAAGAAAGCRDNDAFRPALVVDSAPPASFQHGNRTYWQRAPKTFANTVTAWWDASQIYGYDETSRSRVKRDAGDRAKLALTPLQRAAKPGDELGYLPRFGERCGGAAPPGCDPIHAGWLNQETAAFADNWTIGMSFYHNVFTREHNAFVDAFRARAAGAPAEDSGLRNPAEPQRAIAYAEVTDDELFEAARLVVAAEIAKIHTIEWTTQLLYNEPLYRGMNANWSGLLDDKPDAVKDALAQVVLGLGESEREQDTNSWYSVLAAGPGIVGLGNEVTRDGTPWDLGKLAHVNGGVNHFGSPFNFPEEFTTVYRLHPLVPDLLEVRRLSAPDQIAKKVPAVNAFRAGASEILQRDGIADWALSMGRQRLGALTLQNHGLFLQNLPLPQRDSPSGRLDIAALDIIRDRERGVPRFNEFRRQYGLKQLTSFDDFIKEDIDESKPDEVRERERQRTLAATLRRIYGTHRCDASKEISHAQLDEKGEYPNDCLGHENGAEVDNIEDLDTVVGWLAEPVRPHGYAISETQFVVFILNASRRLFSDRFFTSSFRPEFYTTLGYQWVQNNGPAPMMEDGQPNGHEQPVSPLKRVLLRTIPALAAELDPVINVFDPWARDRGDYYSLQWQPRPGAENDVSFAAGQ